MSPDYNDPLTNRSDFKTSNNGAPRRLNSLKKNDNTNSSF